MDWLPTLAEWQGPVFLRIVDALAADIASGRLVRGQQIPTHRALASALKIDLTTVTRAYGEARRRGLLEAQVGRGTFISETTARAAADIPSQVKIDLSMNLPPQPVEANLDLRIAQGFAAIQNEASFSAFLNYQRAGGKVVAHTRARCQRRAPGGLSRQSGGPVQCPDVADVAGGRGADRGLDV